MAVVRIRYWAGARAAAGTPDERVEASTIRSALGVARDRRPGDPDFARVVAVSSVLVDGRAVPRDRWDEPFPEGAVGDPAGGGTAELVELEVLPPFAGG